MKKSIIPIIFFLIFSISGCRPVLKTLYGIKKPKIENESSILRKAEKFKFDTENILTVNSGDFLSVLVQQGIPDGSLYDRDGKYIEYRQTDSSCNAGLFEFIPALNPETIYSKPDKATLWDEMTKFRDLKGNILTTPEPADFYLVIYWTIWTGKLNKDHVEIWEELAKKNTACNIKVIKVNLDLQEYWDEQERNNIIQLMSKKKDKKKAE